MNPQIVETVLNVVYFLVGLLVGLFGLWQNQKYFQAQQQDKFDQINDELRQIRERLAMTVETTSERAFKRESELIRLATQHKSLDEDTLYSDIQGTIHSALTSDDVVKELFQTLSSQVSESLESDIDRVLETVANRTTERIREVSFLEIDSRPIEGDRSGTVWQVSYAKYPHVSSLLDEIYFSLQPHVAAFTYGSAWALRDSKTGYIYKEIGRTWAENRASTFTVRAAATVRDARTLQEVGIEPGMRLETIFL